MNQDTHNTEQVYQCQDCQIYHQEPAVAVRTEIVNGHVSRTMYCDQCGSEELRLCTENDAIEDGRRQRENDETRIARHELIGE